MENIEWIKAAVGVCARDEADFDKQEKFNDLEQVFLNKTNEEQDEICKIICQQFEKKDAIYIFTQLLFFTKNNKYTENILDLLLDIDFSWFEGSMIALQLCRYDIANMKKRRNFHRKVVAKYEEMLQFEGEYIPVSERNEKRIIVVTQQILHLHHSPTIVVLNFVYALKRLGYEILLFVCPQDGGVDSSLWFHPISSLSNEDFQKFSKIISYKDEVFRVYQISMSEVCGKEYRMMYDIIYEWKPYFVFDCGTANPVIDAINKFTTLVSLEMSMACPVSEADILLRFGKQEMEIEEDYENGIATEQNQFFINENIPVTFDNSMECLSRGELNLPCDRFLVAIVGNRLDIEMTEENILLMDKIASQNKEIDFVIIGNVEVLIEKLSTYEWKHRVHYIGYQEDLLAAYRALDLYLNPKRMGGGWSAAIALMAGIPVITYPKCDVAFNVGLNFVVNDEEELLTSISNYVDKEDFYKKHKEYALQFAHINSESKLIDYTQRLVDNMQVLIDEK